MCVYNVGEDFVKPTTLTQNETLHFYNGIYYAWEEDTCISQ